jgi:hypothetical protein
MELLTETRFFESKLTHFSKKKKTPFAESKCSKETPYRTDLAETPLAGSKSAGHKRHQPGQTLSQYCGKISELDWPLMAIEYKGKKSPF